MSKGVLISKREGGNSAPRASFARLIASALSMKIDLWPLRILFICVTLLYVIVIPPFEVRDEQAHFAKAAQLASFNFPSVRQNGQSGALLPKSLVQLETDWSPGPIGGPVKKRQPSKVWSGLTARDNLVGLTFADFASLGSYPSVLYVAPAIGIKLGMTVGASPLGQFYAGRLAATVASLSLVLLATGILPFGGRSMLTIASLPGVSAQLASYSADSLITGVAFLLVAILVRGSSDPNPRQHWSNLLLVPLLTLAKGVYFPLAASGLGVREGWRAKNITPTLLTMAVSIGAFLLWYGLFASEDINIQHYTSRVTLQHMTTGTPREQLAFAVANPGTAVWALTATTVSRMPVYALDWIGRFGWLAVLLPMPMYALGAAVLGACAATTRGDATLPTPVQRLLWFCIGVSVFLLVHAALYLVCTAVGESYVEGVQGRYFVPSLPLLALAFRYRARPILTQWIDLLLPIGSLLLSLGGLAIVTGAFWSI